MGESVVEYENRVKPHVQPTRTQAHVLVFKRSSHHTVPLITTEPKRLARFINPDALVSSPGEKLPPER